MGFLTGRCVFVAGSQALLVGNVTIVCCNGILPTSVEVKPFSSFETSARPALPFSKATLCHGVVITSAPLALRSATGIAHRRLKDRAPYTSKKQNHWCIRY
eukprot:6419712-Amphidinium_carterae.2